MTTMRAAPTASDATDAGLMKFVPLKKLRTISTKSTALTDVGIAAFQKARPDVKVER